MLRSFLRNIKKEVIIVSENIVPDETKFLIFKIADIQRYLSPLEQANLAVCIERISECRANDGRPDNDYWVVNLDEPYAGEVGHLIMRHEAEKAQKEGYFPSDRPTQIQ